ncbi:hypothetical protein B0O99DRAFT_625745 [Bisporella sp. PMI_857]|nr:hypothetical protein B0O99DRAFT_625745 [Bisporella sp. PMI_857]
MYSRLNLRLISIFALLFAITHASLFDLLRQDGVARRQDSSNGGILDDIANAITSERSTSVTGTSSTPTSATESTTSGEPTITPPTSTPSPTSSPSSTTPTSSERPQSNTSGTSTSGGSSTSTPAPSSTGSSDSSSDTSMSQSTFVVKVTTTIDGVPQESSYTTTTDVPAASASSSGSGKGSESTSSGMSSSTKKTVIGVVVGIVGAIVLGALFFVAWRIWGRKKSEEEGDDLMGPYRGGSSHGLEKTSDAGSMPSPFTATLDQYHNPNGKNANVSSNF